MYIGKEKSVIFVLKEDKTMAKIIIEVEKGTTSCCYCPFCVVDCYGLSSCIGGIAQDFPCEKYDLTTMEITEVKED